MAPTACRVPGPLGMDGGDGTVLDTVTGLLWLAAIVRHVDAMGICVRV